ncbi:MAG TPA: hypothetical protein VGB70_04645 [Allosphingosinicella sp.]|jgi:hypothetical protein
MPKPTVRTFAFSALAALLALAGCNRGDDGNLASLDNQLTNDTDPALSAALQDQIAVDPELAGQSNRNAVRPPETPTTATYPADTMRAPEPKGAAAAPAAGAQLAAAPAAGGGNPNCTDNAKFHYNNGWAQRLPAAFPLYPAGKLTEAAANNSNGCAARVVSFTTADNFQRVLDWYHTRAVRAGYTSEHEVREGDHILAGANARDNGAFYLIVTPRGNGSEVALIVNKGR